VEGGTSVLFTPSDIRPRQKPKTKKLKQELWHLLQRIKLYTLNPASLKKSPAELVSTLSRVTAYCTKHSSKTI
jgi:hypothetical protein